MPTPRCTINERRGRRPGGAPRSGRGRLRNRRYGPTAAALLCLATLLGRPTAVRGQADVDAPTPFELVKLDENHRGLWRHAGTYATFGVRWHTDERLTSVKAVFPHPVLPRRVVVAATERLLVSDSAGRTWEPLPAWTRPDSVRHVAFSLTSPDTFYVASGVQGVWATADAGKTFGELGSADTGLADTETVHVCIYPADRRGLTLVAAHGDAAAGISVSDDGGRSWRVLASDYHIYRTLPDPGGDTRLFFVAATTDEPYERSIYTCHSLDEPWYEVVRDILPTDLAPSLLKGPIYVGTADTGMIRLTADGTTARPVGPADVTAWASVGVTWGAQADQQLVYAYDPLELGMVVSTDGLKTTSSHSRGLITGPLVGEGAHIRASADGSRFFAVANGSLCRGVVSRGRLRVDVEPPALTFATQAHRRALDLLRKALRPITTARAVAEPAARLVEHASEIGTALSAPRVTVTAEARSEGLEAVTVDFSRLGGSPRTPMTPDPEHGPGVYTAAIPFNPEALRPDDRDWRRRWPGRLGLSVTAVSESNVLAGGIGTLFVADRPESFLWRSDFRWWKPFNPDGILSLEGTNESARGPGSWTALTFTVGPGPWRLPIGNPYATTDITGYHAFGFWVKADRELDPGFSVQVRDNPDYVIPVLAEAVPPVSEGLVHDRPLARGYRRVLVPIKRLLNNAPTFQTRLMGYVIFSGKAPQQTTYWIDDVRFYLTPDDVTEQTRRIVDE